MSEGTEIRCWAYVTHPYSEVREVIATDPTSFLGGPTNRAVARAESLTATLKVNIAGFEIGRDVLIEVIGLDFTRHPPHEPNAPAVSLELRWKAANNSSLFPSMKARLMVYPLSSGETQLDLYGVYTPPGGVIGGAADALVGHRIAEASMHRFLEDVVDALNRRLLRAS